MPGTTPSGPDAYFVRDGEHAFRPTALTGGGWSTDEQHISPMNGLVVHEVERFVAARGDDDLQIGRIGLDILGVLPLEVFEVAVEVVRPGRTIELLEVVVTSGGRAALRARVWRMAVADTAAAAGDDVARLPRPEGLPTEDLTRTWPGGFIGSLEFRPVSAHAPGRRAGWITSPVALVEAEHVSDLARFVGYVDTMNGIAVRRSPDAWMYPNLDLTIHLFRQPVGTWVGLDTTVDLGARGLGLTSAAVHDERGPVGRAAQALTVRPRG